MARQRSPQERAEAVRRWWDGLHESERARISTARAETMRQRSRALWDSGRGVPPRSTEASKRKAQAASAQSRRQKSGPVRAQVLKGAQAGRSITDLAREFPVSRTTVRDWCREAGIKPVRGRGRGGFAIGKVPVIDLCGRTFGDWTVLHRAPPEGDTHGQPRWVCRCICGAEVIQEGRRLRDGARRIFACPHARAAAAKLRRDHHAEYVVWMNLRKKGEVAPGWQRFEAFFADTGCRPPGGVFVRLSERGPYGPHNCEYVRRGRPIKPAERDRLKEWARSVGLPYKLVWDRLSRGWSLERTLGTPFQQRGEDMTAGLRSVEAALQTRVSLAETAPLHQTDPKE